MNKLTIRILGVLALLASGGCEFLEHYSVDPPALVLELGPPPPPRIAKVEITNGAGKTVMSGYTSYEGKLSANPDLADLDGTLTIKSTWTDGDVVTQTATHRPNSRVSLTYDRDRHGFVVEEIPASSLLDDAPEGAGG